MAVGKHNWDWLDGFLLQVLGREVVVVGRELKFSSIGVLFGESTVVSYLCIVCPFM